MPGIAAAAVPRGALAMSNIDQIAQTMRHGGDESRRVIAVGAMRNVGTTYTAISLARTLAQHANVVLVDMSFVSPNLSVISSDPNAPGIAELVRGKANFGEIITGDRYSPAHVVAAGAVANDAGVLSASPMLATMIEALVRTYDHVVIDVGSATDTALERVAPLAGRAVLVSSDPADAATKAARERLMAAGIADVMVVAGAPEVIAA